MASLGQSVEGELRVRGFSEVHRNLGLGCDVDDVFIQ